MKNENNETKGHDDGEELKTKKTRNKFKGILWDYYATNREVTKQYDAQYEKEREQGTNKGRRWSGTEKLYLAVIIIGVALIGIKYLLF